MAVMRPVFFSSLLPCKVRVCSITRRKVSRVIISPIFRPSPYKHNNHFFLPFRCLSIFTQDYYAVIGVSKTASQAEIKKEYFRKAKQYHPDLNPNDKTAVKKFQELATAYETLGNPQKRKEYDRLGYRQYAQHTAQGQHYASGRDANDVFNDVYKDFEIIQWAWNDYITETKEDFVYACQEADRNNWTPMYDVAKANGAILLGIVVPVAVLLRMPAAVAVAMRFIVPVISSIGVGIIRSGNSGVFAAYLWKKIVEIARNRKKRKPGRK